MLAQGAPLAYTPFCDNNKDMDGFRFWKQGFWKDHLRGRSYHISALYVVDLARFRCAPHAAVFGSASILIALQVQFLCPLQPPVICMHHVCSARTASLA